MNEKNENKAATNKDKKKESIFGGVAKDILLSTIGTTISIILTFGTSSMIDSYQAAQSRKLLAMTIIHEIDKDIEQVRECALLESEYNKLCNSYYQSSDEDLSFELIGTPVYDYPEFSRSNERIFNSSQDTWSTIDNYIFISNVQDYYKARASLERAFKEDTCFLPYFPEEKCVYHDVTIQIENLNGEIEDQTIHDIDYQATFQKCGGLNKVYFQSANRLMWYNTLLNYKSINEENKILMGISDQDLEEFVKKTADARKITEKELLGTWIPKTYQIDSWNSNGDNIFTFHKNNRLTVHNRTKYSDPEQKGTGDIWVYYTATGKWKIEDDSLTVTFPADNFEVKIDDNYFYYYNVSHWQEIKQSIEDADHIANGENLLHFISTLGHNFIEFKSKKPYVAKVNAHIDRFGKAIIIRHPQYRDRKRFEKCDTITIPSYDFVKHPARENEILGKWVCRTNANTIQMEYNHQGNHSFTIQKADNESNFDLFDGVMTVNCNISGEWKMENDSLIYYFDSKTLNISIDDSRILYQPNKAEALNGYMSQLKDIYTQRTLQSTREAYHVITNAKRIEMIDKNGNTKFLYRQQE